MNGRREAMTASSLVPNLYSLYSTVLRMEINYAHFYPSKQKALADRLNEDRGDVDVIMEKKEAE